MKELNSVHGLTVSVLNSFGYGPIAAWNLFTIEKRHSFDVVNNSGGTTGIAPNCRGFLRSPLNCRPGTLVNKPVHKFLL